MFLTIVSGDEYVPKRLPRNAFVLKFFYINKPTGCHRVGTHTRIAHEEALSDLSPTAINIRYLKAA